MLPAGGETSADGFRAILRTRARLLPVELDLRLEAALSEYLAMLDRSRRQTNLTGPIGPEALADHALESLVGGSFLPEGARAADIGAGAGFPGVPLALARPDVSMTPVEPRRKRREFLHEVRRSVPVGNLQSPSAGALPDGSIDVVVTRAVGRLGAILGSARYLISGGWLLAWTTSPVEIGRTLHARFLAESVLPVPGSDRKVVAIFRAR